MKPGSETALLLAVSGWSTSIPTEHRETMTLKQCGFIHIKAIQYKTYCIESSSSLARYTADTGLSLARWRRWNEGFLELLRRRGLDIRTL
ncbi:hypothetical protein FKM82_022145 [Ascaphus truei]